MLLLLLISHLTVVLASPFHKYPYVFLLDVGNEEIEKVNTEQIRLSIPGGSLAVRYPAVGEGDIIEHVRISGIDFGTDLKASIVQGGPGYKYVVFVFMGNPGVAYDAVVTIQTVPNMDMDTNINVDSSINANQVLEDANDSAVDMSDKSITKSVYSDNTKSQVMQSSSNVYQYSVNDNTDDDDVKDMSLDDEKSDDTDEDAEDEENDDDDNDDSESQSVYDYTKEDSSISSDNNNENNKQYGKYEAFKPHWYGGIRFYPQAAIYTQNEYSKPVYDPETDNEDEKSDANIIVRGNNYYKDDNNNEEADDGPPVEY